MRRALMFLDGKSYMEFGEEKFYAVLENVEITPMKDSHSIRKWSDAYWAFRSYGMDVRMMEGTVPDDSDLVAMVTDLKAYLGEDLKPIIFMYINREDE